MSSKPTTESQLLRNQKHTARRQKETKIAQALLELESSVHKTLDEAAAQLDTEPQELRSCFLAQISQALDMGL